MVLVNWNACSIKSKTIELKDFLEEKEIDVAFITETHLKPEVNVHIPDFRIVRLDRPTRGGGVAIALRYNINVRLLPSFQLSTIEAIGVEVTTSVGTITLIAAYCPTQAKDGDGSSVTLRKDIVAT